MSVYILYFIIYPILSVILFVVANWLGKYSENLGYNKINFIIDKEDSLAFNFTFKVLTPVIFIIIVSSIFYKFDLDEYTKNIYFIVIYTVLGRVLFNIAMERFHIINKKIYLLNSVLICMTSYLTYIYLIKPKTPIIPDFNTLSNELWIIIILFLYNTVNKIEIPEKEKTERLKKYVIIQYKNTKNRFDEYIKPYCQEKMFDIFYSEDLYEKNLYNDDGFIKENTNLFILLTYSIIIFENFNRPKYFRKIETFLAKNSTKKRTLGIMQVATNDIIDDIKSIEIGIEKLCKKYHQEIKNLLENDDSLSSYLILYQIILDYNPSEEYQDSIMNIMNILSNYIYGNNIIDSWEVQLKKISGNEIGE